MSYPINKVQRLTDTAERLTQELATATNPREIIRLTGRLQEVTAELEKLTGLTSAPSLSEKESAKEIINDFTKRDLAALEQSMPTIGDTHSQEPLTLDEIEARFDVLGDMIRKDCYQCPPIVCNLGRQETPLLTSRRQKPQL